MHYIEIVSNGIQQTLVIGFSAFAMGLVLAVPLVCLRCAPNRVVRLVSAGLIELTRAIPPLVWLFVCYFAISEWIVLSSMQAAILGLGVITGAYLSEVYRGALNSVAVGQWEAAHSLGLPPVTVYVRVILPQAFVAGIQPAFTYGISLLKDTSLAALIGATEITYWALRETRVTFDGLQLFAVAGAFYIGFSLILGWVGDFVDSKATKWVA